MPLRRCEGHRGRCYGMVGVIVTLADESPTTLNGFPTWYRVVRPSGRDHGRPLVLLHGGPGMDHRTLLSLEALADHGRVVVAYDQLGSGRSSGPDTPRGWSVDLFVDQLEALRQYLAFPRIDLLGHSWGGMLALLYALEHADRVGRLILHGAIACWPHCQRMREQWPWPVDLGDEEARRQFDQTYCCRQVPWPDDLDDAVRDMNVELAQIMWAPSDVHPRGLLADWDIRDRLKRIAQPTLIVAGRHDAYAPGQAELLHAGIAGSQLMRFEQSAHYAHLEEPEHFRKAVVSFLSNGDSVPH